MQHYRLTPTTADSFDTAGRGTSNGDEKPPTSSHCSSSQITLPYTLHTRISNRIRMMGRSVLLLSCFSIGIILFPVLPSQAAKSNTSTHAKTAASSNPPVPPNLGAPKGRTGGGASRGTCDQAQTMRAVLPDNSNRSYDLTTSDHPTLWFYLPERSDPNAQMEFVIQDAADNYIYRTTFIQPNTSAGLISLTVPESSPVLTAGAVYNWTLSIQCNPARPSQMSFIRGAIQRVATTSSLSPDRVSTDHIVTARLYAQQGYWSDAITILAHALQAQPLNPSAIQLWKDLLAHSGVTDLRLPSVAVQKSKSTEIGPAAIIPSMPHTH